MPFFENSLHFGPIFLWTISKVVRRFLQLLILTINLIITRYVSLKISFPTYLVQVIWINNNFLKAKDIFLFFLMSFKCCWYCSSLAKYTLQSFLQDFYLPFSAFEGWKLQIQSQELLRMFWPFPDTKREFADRTRQ